MIYKQEHRELVETFGIPQEIAQSVLESRNKQEVETVIKFLRRYGHYIDLNSNEKFVAHSE